MEALTGTLEVKEGSHTAHEEYWDRVSPLSPDRKASIGDWYLFEPEARSHSVRMASSELSLMRCSQVFGEGCQHAFPADELLSEKRCTMNLCCCHNSWRVWVLHG